MDKYRIDYIVGGFRISLKDGSNTPGPRNHIVNFISAAETQGHAVNKFVVSELPLMNRFSRVSQSDYKGSSAAKVWVADLVRIAAAVWCGAILFLRSSRDGRPDVIYERVAVLQSLTSFHAKKRGAVRVVEANGILARETSKDRKVLRSVRLATWLERRVLRRADLVIAVSVALKAELLTYADIDPAAVMVVPNGVSTELGRIRRTKSENVTIGFAGSVVAWHHLDELIDAVKSVNQVRVAAGKKPVHLEVVGDGPELIALRSKMLRENMEPDVSLLGQLDQFSTYQRMAGWDIGFAGHRKSSSAAMYHSPLKLYEYAALGLKILCTESPDAESLEMCGVQMRTHSGGDTVVAGLHSFLDTADTDDDEIEMIRQSVLKEHSWEAKVTAVLSRAVLAERAG